MNKNELSKRIDVSLKTLYNWEETKPELIKLIKLGLEKEEEHLKENVEKMEKNITKIAEFVSIEKLKNEERFLEINKNFKALEILIRSLDKK